MIRIALAGRYAMRHEIAVHVHHSLRCHADIRILADWLTAPEASDEALTDAQALEAISTNIDNLVAADVLLYIPDPVLSPGRMADVGMARLLHTPIVSIGPPEPTIYLRGCRMATWETVAQVCREVGG